MRIPVDDEALTPTEERRLIVDALDGNERCMRALVARISKIIVREAGRALFRMRLMGGAGYSLSVEDLRQEILVLLFTEGGGKKLAAFDPSIGSLSAYIAPIARNRLTNYLKRQAGSGRAEVPTDAIVAAANTTSPQVRHLLVCLLEALRADLSDSMWQTFLLMCVEEKSAKEAAKILGSTTTAIYLRVWKIRRRACSLLREFVAREGVTRDVSDEVMNWLGSLAREEDA